MFEARLDVVYATHINFINIAMFVNCINLNITARQKLL